ncbi:hypothetical protein STCU_12107 [Strigomonas culicis]|uniref:Uncharacterized protein n=1 Tax=Strigomonas culicis TaxID=28005 RepID=S9TBE5_9TRYP|nr:hypothetical protein STCU_12107 [Strigomonas culicis]|eukprot:EPY15337.1 hypothetical protein STCU_12107 [Strigomonas culicis]
MEALRESVRCKQQRAEEEQRAKDSCKSSYFHFSDEEAAEKKRRGTERAYYEQLQAEAASHRQKQQESIRDERECAHAQAQRDAELAQKEEAKLKERLMRQNEKCMAELEKQIKEKEARKKEARQHVYKVSPQPLVPQKALYRCPVTGMLLPAEAFDFRQHC